MCPSSQLASSESDFLKSVEEIQKRLVQVTKEVGFYDSGGALITGWMRQTQALPLAEKLAIYKKYRVEDQMLWYFNKSRFNIRLEKKWFLAIFFVEFFAVALAVIQACQLMEINLVGGMAATSAGFIAWMQTKRFSDLGITYSIAANDIRHISEKHGNIDTEEKFSLFLNEIETAVSREHAIWLTRRID